MLNEVMEKLSSQLSKEEVEINMFMRIIQNTCIHLDNYMYSVHHLHVLCRPDNFAYFSNS